MKFRLDELAKFDRDLPPAPPPIEPVLPARDEARLIAKGSDPTVAARRARVLRLIQRAETPKGPDAELIALLAEAGDLPLERREDRLSARQRISGIGSLTDPPPEVRELVRRLRVKPGDGPAFAEALLGHDNNVGSMSENFPAGGQST